MFRIFAAIVLMFLFSVVGCSAWQANNASQAVTIDPTAIGTGRQVIAPADNYGYIDGMPQDMRTKH